MNTINWGRKKESSFKLKMGVCVCVFELPAYTKREFDSPDCLVEKNKKKMKQNKKIIKNLT